MDEQQWYDLFEDVAAKLKHGNMTRQQQHAELARIVAAERERCAKLCEEMFSFGALEIAGAIRGA